MTPLARRIAGIVRAEGPIGVDRFMQLCLADPEHGYYTTREPFGIDGDFVTAPEISQMFGELVAVWLLSAWRALGRPAPVVLAEIGPGRGTLMADMLRTLSRLDPGMVATSLVRLVENSPRLEEVQRRTLAGGPAEPVWCKQVAQLPDGPLLLVANELFDALPMRQHVRTADGWRERVVTLGAKGELAFAEAKIAAEQPSAVAPLGTILESAPARSDLMAAIAGRIAGRGGAALAIDYGYAVPGFGDTLQALRRHAADPVLARPGEADLTSHVDFHALAEAAKGAGAQARVVTQGAFLLGLGLLERAGRLGAGADLAGRDAIAAAVERLAGADGMGELFKVLCVTPRGIEVPPFGTASADALTWPTS